jgi:hypothetical protein
MARPKRTPATAGAASPVQAQATSPVAAQSTPDVSMSPGTRAPAEAPAAATIAPAPNLIPIEYVGKKAEKRDNVADTGLSWRPGQIHFVTPRVAVILLRYPDIWRESWDKAESDPGSVGLVVEDPPPPPEPTPVEKRGQVAFDLPNLQGMTNDDLVKFAQSAYGQTLSAELDKGVLIQQIVTLSNSKAAGEIE